MSNNRVREHLSKRFEDNRIVIWHDPHIEFSDELDTLAPESVTVLRVENNEFAIKHRVLREHANEKFLIYRAGTVPEGADNWLLDLELAYFVFTADRNTLIQADLGITLPGAEAIFSAHSSFFANRTLLGRFKRLISDDDDLKKIQAKMCAAALNQSEHSYSELTRTLLIRHSEGGDNALQPLEDEGLADFYWRGAEDIYGYESANPSLASLVFWVFRQAEAGFAGTDPRTARNLQIDFRGYRNDRRSGEALKQLARQAEDDLGYKTKVGELTLTELIDTDIFETTEHELTRRLVSAIEHSTMSEREITEIIRTRRAASVWYDDNRHIYSALEAAAAILPRMKTAELGSASFDAGLTKYRDELFRIDQLYRQFTHAKNQAERPEALKGLPDTVEKMYVKDFLYALGSEWQKHVDQVEQWKSAAIKPQTAFYKNYVEPIVSGGRKKAVVVISDALRYEVAEELHTRILGENKYEASLDAVLGVLPSYTQLGMAALLPHESLAHSVGGDPVLVDGESSKGTTARDKILAKSHGAAITASEFMKLKGNQRRELYSANQILYIYHNVIDARGDHAPTEHEVFEAAEQAMREVMELLRALTSANATNVFVTADHGFLYQDGKLPKQFMLSAEPHGDEIVARNRRYVLGRGLKEDPAFRRFMPAQLGLQSDLEVLIPKSILRIPRQGAGSRFVHGGATLQEIVVPVVSIKKGRSDTVEPVTVDIYPEAERITTGQMVVKVYQTSAVSAQRPALRLRAGLYWGDLLISNTADLLFDQSSEEPRDRYQHVRLLLSREADEANGESVEFRLEEPIADTDEWKTYKTARYTLKRAFGTDFDF